MNPSIGQAMEDNSPERSSSSHASKAFEFFLQSVGQTGEANVLDMGPICGENIRFLADRVKRLHLCDMFSYLDRALREGLPSRSVFQNLDYPSQSFDGIILWDLIDHMADNEAARLAGLCHTMMKPQGMLVVFLLGQNAIPSSLNSFVLRNDFELHMRSLFRLNLPFLRRHSRDLSSLLVPFTPVKSFIYRNGIREFVFKRSRSSKKTLPMP